MSSSEPVSDNANNNATTVRVCIVCQWRELDATEMQTCLKCLTKTRAYLAEITELYATLPALLGHPKTTRYDSSPTGSNERPLPGGDALVMMAAGSGAKERLRNFLQGRDEAWDQDDSADDAPSIAFELSRWEDDWRLQRGERAASGPATVASAAAYLGARMTWASQRHPAYDEFAATVRRLRGRLRNVTGTHDAPVRADVRCFGCDERLERRWTDEGLAEKWDCPACHRKYEPEEYMLALRAAESDARIDIKALTVRFPSIPAGTIRRWASTGKLERRGRDRRGRTLYRVGDIVTLLETLRRDVSA